MDSNNNYNFDGEKKNPAESPEAASNTTGSAVQPGPDQGQTPNQSQPQFSQSPYGGYSYGPGGGYPNGGYPNGYQGAYAYQQPKQGMAGWKKALIIFLIVILVVGIAGWGCSRAVRNTFEGFDLSGYTGGGGTTNLSFDRDYLGVMYLEGTITDGDSGDGYSQSWMLDIIDQMRNDERNRGILMHVNTPGGSSYATAEVYEALLKYKEETGRPIYVYMGSQATSGGYYVSMAADKIWANKECWTGSIGVIVGTLFDFSEIMEKYGVKAYNITSGANKDMGSSYKPMTEEQMEILQSLVDESYSHFVDAVVKGRNMPEATVRKLADGRIYSAQQAKDNGLIDEVGAYEEAESEMIETYGLEDCDVQYLYYEPEFDLLSQFRLFSSQIGKGSSDYDELMKLMELGSIVKMEYIAPVRK